MRSPTRTVLEVESAGLNRPLLKPSDYERFSGRNVRVVTTLAIGNAKTHRGILGGVRGNAVILARRRRAPDSARDDQVGEPGVRYPRGSPARQTKRRQR